MPMRVIKVCYSICTAGGESEQMTLQPQPGPLHTEPQTQTSSSNVPEGSIWEGKEQWSAVGTDPAQSEEVASQNSNGPLQK